MGRTQTGLSRHACAAQLGVVVVGEASVLRERVAQLADLGSLTVPRAFRICVDV